MPLICATRLREKVEGVFYLLHRRRLVNLDVAHVGKQREVYLVTKILLVVVHQGDELIVVVACKRQLSIPLFNEPDHLSHLFRGEAALDAAQVQLANQAIGHRITM